MRKLFLWNVLLFLGLATSLQAQHKDTDGDGVPDVSDKCPKEFGEKHLEGCPDWDRDGIPNYADNCKSQPGPESNLGCPLEGVVDSSQWAAVDIEMVLVEGGRFRMGGDDVNYIQNQPSHFVRVSDFLIGKYEVSFDEYDAFCKATKRSYPPDADWGRDNRPAISVSWYDALEFCNWLSRNQQLKPCYTIEGEKVSCDFSANGYRLPTEAEWEYAARGGAKHSRNKQRFAGSDSVSVVGYYLSNSDGKTQPVGQLQANELGIHDMSGNVWEWCWDAYSSYTPYSENNPTGGTSQYRCLRGGAWASESESRLETRFRSYEIPFNRDYLDGFRVVRRNK